MSSIDDFKKSVNFIGLLLGVIGIVLSLIFYFNEKKVKQLAFFQNGSTSLIYDSKNSSSSIKMYEGDSILTTNNVYLLTGTIWNSIVHREGAKRGGNAG